MTWQMETAELKTDIITEKPHHIDCNTYGLPMKFIDKVRIGDNYVTFEEFFALVEYVLENTDLYDNDPRLNFMEKIKRATIVDGWESIYTKKPCTPKRIELGRDECIST
jgi:hypothetical protein